MRPKGGVFGYINEYGEPYLRIEEVLKKRGDILVVVHEMLKYGSIREIDVRGALVYLILRGYTDAIASQNTEETQYYSQALDSVLEFGAVVKEQEVKDFAIQKPNSTLLEKLFPYLVQTWDFKEDALIIHLTDYCVNNTRPEALEFLLNKAKAINLDLKKRSEYYASKLVRNTYVDPKQEAIRCLDLIYEWPGFTNNEEDDILDTLLVQSRCGDITEWLLEHGAHPRNVYSSATEQEKPLFVMWTNLTDSKSLQVMLEHGALLEDGPTYEMLEKKISTGTCNEADLFLISAWRAQKLEEISNQENKTPISSPKPKM